VVRDAVHPRQRALRVIPGSHRRRTPPIDTEHVCATGMGPHPDEVKIIAPAGSVILFRAADLWHAGTGTPGLHGAFRHGPVCLRAGGRPREPPRPPARADKAGLQLWMMQAAAVAARGPRCPRSCGRCWPPGM